MPKTKKLTKKIRWPFNPAMVKEIESYVAPAPRAKLYIWRRVEETMWHYTMSAGANSERSHTGYIPVEGLTAEQAAVKAIEACKKSNSWVI